MSNTVYTLLCKKDIPMALVTLPNIVKFLSEDQEFVVCDDGSFDDETVEIVKNISNKIRVITRTEREEYVMSILKNYPNCVAYRNQFAFAFKLIDIPLLAKKESERFTYTDSDIIYLKNCSEYFNRTVNTYLMTDAIKLSFKLKDGLLKYKWAIPYKFNAGYFSFDTKDFDLDFIEHYLGLPDVRNIPWVSEQACWALLFGKAGASFCPAENQFVCNEKFDGPTSETHAIHLIANLKDKVNEWSAYTSIDKNNSMPTFQPSRNVTVKDWLFKVIKRYLN